MIRLAVIARDCRRGSALRGASKSNLHSLVAEGEESRGQAPRSFSTFFGHRLLIVVRINWINI